MEDEEYERGLKNHEMSANWRMKDVMSYFGEYIGENERLAMIIVRTAERRVGKSAKYNHLMSAFRELLVEKGIDIPFSSGYRRVK